MSMRRLGSRVLEVAIRRTRPELRAWGRAMLNEMDAIENDWAAFQWAIGGAVSLFCGYELPISDVSEVPRRLENLENILRRKLAMDYLVCFLVIGGFAHYFVTFLSIGERIASVLTILGAGFAALQIRWNSVRRRAVASPGDSSAAMERYRVLLQHMRDFHRGTWFWSRLIVFLPGPLLFAYEFHRNQPEPLESFLIAIIVFLGLGILAIPLNLNRSRKFQREIDRLNNLKEPL